jgi:hypothetical protein
VSDVSADLTAASIVQPTSASAASGAHGVAETITATIQSLMAADSGLSALDALLQATETALAGTTRTVIETGGSGGIGTTGGTYGPRPSGVTGSVLYVGADDPTSSAAANSGAPALATDVWLPFGAGGTAVTAASIGAATATALTAETSRATAAETAAQTRASAAPYLIFYGPSSWPARPSTTIVPAGQAEYVSLTAGVAAPTDSHPGDRLLIATVSTSGVLPAVASGTLIADWNVGAQGLANGASVPTLVDATGHGHTLTSAGSAEATIIASWQNGKAGASFAGTAYYQVHSDATLVPTTGGFTVFVVFSEATAAPLPASSYSALFSTKYGGGNSGLSLDAWNTYDESTAGPQLVDDSTGATNTLYLDGSTTAVTYTVGTPHVATLVSTAVPTTNSGYFAVGENATGSGGPFTGVIGRVVAYTGALNNTDRAAVEAALAAEFGFTG